MDSEEHRANIEADLSRLFNSNSAQGSFTTGGFAFSEPDMNTAIQNWLDLAYSYYDSITKAELLTIIQGPGLDFASESFANAANNSGQEVITYFTNNMNYCFEKAQLFYNALNDYLGLEHANVAEFDKKNRG